MNNKAAVMRHKDNFYHFLLPVLLLICSCANINAPASKPLPETPAESAPNPSPSDKTNHVQQYLQNFDGKAGLYFTTHRPLPYASNFIANLSAKAYNALKNQ
ncbi:hypothetical protein [Methylomusa anaerophila]|uniref:hypothetical protein n=1 Tax=Methylomusa anaerophila TaxID=1930071 RepID=UPI0011AE57D9|nr:hypothetical protein [Methylomusa anaerophila]